MMHQLQTPRMHRSRNTVLLAASIGASFAVTACSPGDLAGPDNARPASIALRSSGSGSLASLGDSAVLQPQVLDESGHPLSGVPLRWSASPAGIVVQDAEGVYRAIGNGRVTIVAEIDVGKTGVRPDGYWAGRIADSVVIDVQQRGTRLTLAPVDTAFSTLGALRQLRVLVTDARGNPLARAMPSLTWTSAQPGVVKVDGTGAVRSVAEGTGLVTVQAEGLSGAATFTVRPRLPHTSCMVFAQRRQSKQSCVTLDFVVREREAGL
jgi:hypothetical protein